MNILCIMHADFETPGVIESWATENDYIFNICKPYRGEDCLAQPDFDFLIVMGGPQSPLEIEDAPYLVDEIELIREAIAADKKVLGFCLGAQLIGEALGAQAERSPEKEVGVFPIFFTDEVIDDPLLGNFPLILPVIHWHNDMPGETKESQVLAYSQGCPRQIIKYSAKVYGFQCHLEITDEGIIQMIEACPHDLSASKFTQTETELILNDYASINESMLEILDNFVNLESLTANKKAVC